jgi:hypothetical protein
MDWDTIIKTVTVSGFIISATAWLVKEIIKSSLEKDTIQFKSNLERESSLAIKKFELEAEKKIIEYTSLHSKRASLVAEMYAKIYDLQGAITKLLYEYQYREIREDVDKKRHPNRDPGKIVFGVHTLTEDEEKVLKELSCSTSDFYIFYGRNKIYFSETICNLVDRFATLASYMSFNYQNVALKDEHGELYVNPEIKKVWDKAIEVIPELLSLMEQDFRKLLGVIEKP